MPRDVSWLCEVVVVVVMCRVHVQCYLCLFPSRYNAHLCAHFTDSRCHSILWCVFCFTMIAFCGIQDAANKMTQQPKCDYSVMPDFKFEFCNYVSLFVMRYYVPNNYCQIYWKKNKSWAS